MKSSENDINQSAPYAHLRICILQTLYDCFKKYPYAPVELNHIAKSCLVDKDLLNWNIVYLEKKEFLELDRSNDCPPYVSCTATISAKGIDYLESRFYA